MAEVWALEPVADAVALASPVLARRIHQVRAGHIDRPTQVIRAATSLHRYLLRLQHRSTPFGLFAGIAPARVGSELAVRWGERHRALARADAEWLSELISPLETCHELLRRLPVMANPTCIERDGRLVIPYQQPPPHETQRAPGEVSVRYTRAVQIVVAAASWPVVAADLADRLAADYPDTPADASTALLAELVAHGVLLTNLRPPTTVTDPLGHVVDQLATADAETIAAVAPTARALRETRATLTRWTATTTQDRAELRALPEPEQRALADIVRSAGLDQVGIAPDLKTRLRTAIQTSETVTIATLAAQSRPPTDALS